MTGHGGDPRPRTLVRPSCAEGHRSPVSGCLDCDYLDGCAAGRTAIDDELFGNAAVEARRVADEREAARDVLGSPDSPLTDEDLERGKAAVLEHLGGDGVPVDVLEVGERLASGAITLDEARALLGLPPVGSGQISARRSVVTPALIGLAFVVGALVGFAIGAAL